MKNRQQYICKLRLAERMHEYDRRFICNQKIFFNRGEDVSHRCTLSELFKSLDEYFPTKEAYPKWVREQFRFDVEAADLNDEYLDELVEIQQSQVQQQLFRTTTLSTFLCQQMNTSRFIAKEALEICIPFVTAYLCEQSFLRMLNIRTKKRTRLCCEN